MPRLFIVSYPIMISSCKTGSIMNSNFFSNSLHSDCMTKSVIPDVLPIPVPRNSTCSRGKFFNLHLLATLSAKKLAFAPESISISYFYSVLFPVLWDRFLVLNLNPPGFSSLSLIYFAATLGPVPSLPSSISISDTYLSNEGLHSRSMISLSFCPCSDPLPFFLDASNGLILYLSIP